MNSEKSVTLWCKERSASDPFMPAVFFVSGVFCVAIARTF